MGPSFTCFIIGEDTLTVRCADILLNRGHTIKGIISQNQEISRWANEHNVRLVEPEGDLQAILGKYSFDYLFSIANLRLLPKKLLELPRKGTINFHDGPLPRYAGIHSTSWALMNQESEHGITWHLISDVVDGGGILKQQPVPITEGETAFSLNAKCFAAGIETFAELIDELSKGTHQARQQDLSTRSYFGMWQRPETAGVISWSNKAARISALVRALDLGPYPNAIGRPKVMLGDSFMLCTQVDVFGSSIGLSPATITAIEPGRIRIASEDKEIGIGRLLTLFGKPITVQEIVKHYGLRVGTQLPEPSRTAIERITRLNNETCKYESFWRKRLSSLQPVSLPYLEMGDAGPQATHTDELDLSIESEVFSALRNLWPGRNRADIAVSAFSLYLSRLGGESRFDLGLRFPWPAETCDDLAELFARAVPWRIDVDCDAPARLSLDRVLEELQAAREKKTYLLDVWSRYPELRAVQERGGIPPLTVQVELVESVVNRRPKPGHGLAFVADEDGHCQFVFHPSALRVDNARLMAGQFRTFLNALSREPEKSVAQLPLLTQSERKQILFSWNETSSPFPEDKCKPQLFEEQVERTPDSIAIVYKEEEITYAELNSRANRLARYLRRRGVGPDVVVGIYVERSVEMLVGLLGIQKAGGAYLPLDPTYPKERLAVILEDANVRVLVTLERHFGLLPQHRATVVGIDAEWPEIAKEDAANFDSGARPHHLAYVIYTSGSTGKPKGVMIEHRNVVSFFTGMDARIPHQPGNVWLAVTSLSFDISVLELFWTLCRGFKVVIHPDDRRMAAAGLHSSYSSKPIDYSLFYFSADQGENPTDKYRLLIEGAKFGDENGFTAIWTPERHFHAFGGLYPNPSVTGAALAMITNRLHIRSGSVVAPLHSAIRIAEEWSVVDNLSGGRVGLSFASGWMPDDFVIRPDDFADRKDATFRIMGTVRRLWRGDAVAFLNPLGKDVSVKTLPRPIQKELPVWVTTAGNPETYEMAAKAGANILTHLLGQTVEEVGKKIELYHKTWKQAGHPGRGLVTLMLHTFVSDNLEAVKSIVRQPLIAYLRTSADLLKKYSSAFPAFKNQGHSQINFGDLAPDQLEAVLQFAFDRYFETSGLFGTPESCSDMVDKLKAHGVDEIACLLDFGVATEVVLANLKYLNVLRAATSRPSAYAGAVGADYSIGALIRRFGVTHFQCTPSMARMLVADNETRSALCQLQVLMIGGEAFPVSLAGELQKVVTGRIINMYGPTETTIWSGTHALNGETGSIPIGYPILNTQFYIVNRALQPQPVAVPGELLIGGSGVARGYLNRKELTAERFIPNPFLGESNVRVYRTGDLACYLPDGNIKFLGRMDHQVKIRGHRIELGEIETALNQHPLVGDSVVIAREHTPGDLRLIAYVTPRDQQPINTVQLREYLRERLPDHMTPARVVQLDVFPQTPNKKIDRKALPAPDEIGHDAKRAIEPPRGAVETKLATIWAEILGIREIGRTDDFFSLGGDSLSLVQVTLKAEEIFGKKISMGAFVQARTLEQVARLVEEKTSSQPAVRDFKRSDNITIRPMREADLDAVIQIHVDHFPDWLVTMLGRPFLRKMYHWYLKTHGDLALVAVKDGTVVGFTVATVGPYKKSLFFYALPEIVRGIATNPLLVIQNSFARLQSTQTRSKLDRRMTDFRFSNNRVMAVKSANGSGVDLMLAFERAAEQRGTKPYFHSWEAWPSTGKPSYGPAANTEHRHSGGAVSR